MRSRAALAASFRGPAVGDVAPGADDLTRCSVRACDHTLLVIDPAIGAVLAAKPVLDAVAPVPNNWAASASTAARSSG